MIVSEPRQFLDNLNFKDRRFPSAVVSQPGNDAKAGKAVLG